MKANDIPGKIQLPFAASAGGSYIRTVPVPSQIGITPGAASYTDGFPPLNFTQIALGGVPPSGQDMNGVLNAISALSRWFSSGAPIPWDGTFSIAIGGYPKGAIVQSVTTFGTIWVCTADDNITNPDTGGANWTDLLTFIGGLTQAAILALIASHASGLGIGQTWQNFTGVRAYNTVYTNGTASPIQVAIAALTGGAGSPVFLVNGNGTVGNGTPAPTLPTADAQVQIFSVIPPGQNYEFHSSAVPTIYGWSELRA